MPRIILSIFISILLLTNFLAITGNALAYQLEVNYPEIEGAAKPESSNFLGFINYFYALAIRLAAIVAVGVLVYAGIMYMTAGTLTSTEEARKWIWAALIGLILAIGSWVILNAINPDLVNLDITL